MMNSIENGETSTRKPWNRKLDGRSSTVRKLQQREIGERSKLMFGNGAPEKFRNFQLQGEYNTYAGSEVTRIITAGNIVFAITRSGIATATCCITNKHICNLNTSSTEVVRNFYYNKRNESLITMSVGWEQSMVWRCMSTPIEYIRKNQLDRGVEVLKKLTDDPLRIILFDDLNNKVLIYTFSDGILKVYDLNYSLLYSAVAKKLTNIERSTGVFMLVFEQTPKHLPLRIISSEDGMELASMALWSYNKHVEVIELFNEKILYKFEDEDLIIHDVRRNIADVRVNVDDFSPRPLLFSLPNNQHFLIFKNGKLEVRNFKGECVTRFEDHEMMIPEWIISLIDITSDKDLILSYCRARRQEDAEEVDHIGYFNMSNIHTGKCVLKLCMTDPTLEVSPSTRCTIREALKDVTCFFYDEDQNVIYTGNERGFIHVWSN